MADCSQFCTKEECNSLMIQINNLRQEINNLNQTINLIKNRPGVPGKQGAPGLKGDKGDPGKQGLKGDKGFKGDQGEQGKQGIPGKDGKPGAKGDKGDKGDRGADGLDGAPGQQGAPGRPGGSGSPGRPSPTPVVPSPSSPGGSTASPKNTISFTLNYDKNTHKLVAIVSVNGASATATTIIDMDSFTDCCNQILNRISNTENNLSKLINNTNNKTIDIPSIKIIVDDIKNKLTFSSSINEGKCDPITHDYVDINVYTDNSFSAAFTDLSKQVKAVHKQICSLDQDIPVLLPDPRGILETFEYYLLFTWGWEDQPSNKKYRGVSQLKKPKAEIIQATNANADAIWTKYFEPLRYKRGNQVVSLWSKDFVNPIYTCYVYDKNEGKQFLTNLSTITDLELKPNRQIAYPEYENDNTSLVNAGKFFIPRKVTLVQKPSKSSDEVIKLREFRKHIS